MLLLNRSASFLFLTSPRVSLMRNWTFCVACPSSVRQVGLPPANIRCIVSEWDIHVVGLTKHVGAERNASYKYILNDAIGQRANVTYVNQIFKSCLKLVQGFLRRTIRYLVKKISSPIPSVFRKHTSCNFPKHASMNGLASARHDPISEK